MSQKHEEIYRDELQLGDATATVTGIAYENGSISIIGKYEGVCSMINTVMFEMSNKEEHIIAFCKGMMGEMVKSFATIQFAINLSKNEHSDN